MYQQQTLNSSFPSSSTSTSYYYRNKNLVFDDILKSLKCTILVDLHIYYIQLTEICTHCITKTDIIQPMPSICSQPRTHTQSSALARFKVCKLENIDSLNVYYVLTTQIYLNLHKCFLEVIVHVKAILLIAHHCTNCHWRHVSLKNVIYIANPTWILLITN